MTHPNHQSAMPHEGRIQPTEPSLLQRIAASWRAASVFDRWVAAFMVAVTAGTVAYIVWSS